MPFDPQRVQAVFLAAVDAADPAARLAILDQQCAADSQLRRRVEALLSAHDNPDGYLDRPAMQPNETSDPFPKSDGGALPPTNLQVPHSKPGVTIAGRFRLLEAIGEGGMGTVWMAEQRAPVKRLVALKLIKPGMASPTVLARFEAERQALALMDHPNIAKVLDGGTTEDGRPYFVMELVRGIPLTQYCDERRLPIPARLDLFMQVCQAVQHAHQKGIIHRDIKPTNILVTEHDGQPVPKVIDFGLAKALQGSHVLTEQTLYTAFGAMVGTPIYMAPEQVGINALDVDTRSDVYALGVILYELLTGSTPLERQQFKEAAWDEVCRLIRDEEAPRPSTRLSTSRALSSIAASRHTEPEKLGRLVRGDLDWIVLKALEKDRNRRYETANSLAQDIQRYLANEPVTARSPTPLYRFHKLVRRNKLAVAATAAVAAALLFGAVVSAYFAIQSNRRADDAQRNAEVARDEKTRADDKAHEAAFLSEQAQDSLCRSLFDQARFVWTSNQPGRRWDALSLLAKAERLRTRDRQGIEPPGADAALPTAFELRNQAVAALLVPDARMVREIDLATFTMGRSVTPDGRLAAGMHVEINLDASQKGAAQSGAAIVRLVEVSTGREVAQHTWSDSGKGEIPEDFGLFALALSPDGKQLAFAAPKMMGKQLIGWQVKLLELPEFRLQSRVLDWPHDEDFEPHEFRPEELVSARIAFSPVGTRLVGFKDGQFVIWNLPSGEGKTLCRMEKQSSASELGNALGSLFALPAAFSATGRQLAVPMSDKKIGLWNLETNELGSEIEMPLPMRGPAAFSPSGKLLSVVCGARGDKKSTVVRWNLATGAEQQRISIDAGAAAMPASLSLMLTAFDPKEQRLAVGDGQSIGVYELPSGQRSVQMELSQVVLGGLGLTDLRWLDDGRHLVSVGLAGKLRLWELNPPLPRSAELLGSQKTAQVVFSPDEKWIAATPAGNQPARIIRRATSEPARELLGRGSVVFRADSQQLAVVPSQRLKAMTSIGVLAAIEPGKDDSATVVVEDVASGRELARQKLAGHAYSGAFNRDGQLLVAFRRPDNQTPEVWNVHSNQEVWRSPTELRASALFLSPDGNSVAMPVADVVQRQEIYVWELPSGKKMSQLELADAGMIQDFQISPDSHWAAAPSMNLTGIGYSPGNTVDGRPGDADAGTARITVWRYPSGEKRFSIACPQMSSGIVFSPDGRLLAMGSSSGTIQLWSTERAEEIFRFKPPVGSIQNLTFTPDGQNLAWLGESRKEIELLELPALRRQLEEIGLGW